MVADLKIPPAHRFTPAACPRLIIKIEGEFLGHRFPGRLNATLPELAGRMVGLRSSCKRLEDNPDAVHRRTMRENSINRPH